MYSKWKKLYPEYKDHSFKQFKDYLKIVMTEYKEEVLTNPHGVRFPFYMGDMAIKYVPPILDYRKSVEIKKPLNFLNLATNGRPGKLVWSVDYARKFNKYLPYMAFERCRNFRNEVHEALIDHPEIFRDNKRTKSNREHMIKKKNTND